MEEILKYENRERLYKFLIDDLGFIKAEEKYSHESFGNFYVILSGKEFLLMYVNDRSFLTIRIASHTDSTHWYDLSFIENFIYNPNNINPADLPEIDNEGRIETLNIFLRKDLKRINDLFNRENYFKTKEQLDYLLREQFKLRFPGMVKE